MAPVIQVENLSIIRQGRPTVDNVSWEINEGQQWALLGPNGAGKSTLLSVIGTTTAPVEGTVTVLGHQIGKVELETIRQRLGYVTAHHQLDWPMSALDIVLTAFTNTMETPMRWSATPEQEAQALAQLDRFGLFQVARTNWRGLSQGELGKTFLARASLKSPDLLLLDEPAAGLDLAAREHLLDMVVDLQTHKPTMTTVMVTHHLEELPASTTHAAIMKSGRLVHQGPAKHILTSEILSEAFDTPLAVDFNQGRWSTRRAS